MKTRNRKRERERRFERKENFVGTVKISRAREGRRAFVARGGGDRLWLNARDLLTDYVPLNV